MLLILGSIAAALILLAIVVNQISGDSPTGSGGSLDVELTSCTFSRESLPSVTVGYKVTNRGDRTVDARLRWEYRDDDGARIDTDSTTVRGIAPGDTVKGEETTLLDAPPTSSRASCVLVSVR